MFQEADLEHVGEAAPPPVEQRTAAFRPVAALWRVAGHRGDVP
jgi:hypothetical protein